MIRILSILFCCSFEHYMYMYEVIAVPCNLECNLPSGSCPGPVTPPDLVEALSLPFPVGVSPSTQGNPIANIHINMIN